MLSITRYVTYRCEELIIVIIVMVVMMIVTGRSQGIIVGSLDISSILPEVDRWLTKKVMLMSLLSRIS
jgi:hypothetical protein